MAVIGFQGNDSWFVSRWPFRRLFEDVRSRFSVDQELEFKFKQAQALDGLHFDLMKPVLRNKVMRLIKETITEILNDEENLYIGCLDEAGYRMYKAALPELFGYIEKYENAEWPPIQDN